MNCDDCKHYKWYYERCRKWDCEVDAREVHNCFEQRETPVRDALAGTFDAWCAEHNRTPEKERGRVMQNLNVISHTLRYNKLPYADLLLDAAESYAALFDQCYPGQECTPIREK